MAGRQPEGESMATSTKLMEREKKPLELEITRLLRAPPEAVWRAWTDPRMIVHWWGPAHFTAPAANLELRVGGKYLYSMRDWSGKDYWSTGVFNEIEEPRRLVLTDSFSDPQGNPVPASYYGMKGEFPMEMNVEVKFDKTEEGTMLTIRQRGFPDEENLNGARMGWNTSLDKLEGVLMGSVARGKTLYLAIPGKHEMSATTIFEAPRERVYKAHTDPTEIPKWWGPRRLTTRVEKLEARPGGTWRIVQKDEKGAEYGFHGVFHDAVPPERLVRTWEFEGMPGHVLLETITFAEKDGRTEREDKLIFQSVEDRDGMRRTSGEEGLETEERLAELVEGK